MSDLVTTRLATSADAGTIGELLEQFRTEFDYHADAALPELGGDGPLQVLLAERGGAVVGMLVLQRCHNLARGSGFLLLSDIFVVPAARRCGVARTLMEGARGLMSRFECQGMSLVVSEVNIPALTTAARAGFTSHDQLLFTYDPGEG